MSAAAVTTVTRYRQGAPGRPGEPGQPLLRACDGIEPDFLAGQRRFVDLIEDLTAMPPAAVVSDRLVSTARARGAAGIADGVTAAHAIEMLRSHRWSTYASQQALYWGAGESAPLAEAVRALAGSGNHQARAAVVTALRRLGLDPPEWLVSRLARRQDPPPVAGA